MNDTYWNYRIWRIHRGEYPEWSIGYTPEETLIALKNMRQAVEQKILDEAEVMQEMGE